MSVRETIEKMTDAFNRHDAEAFANLHTPDAVAIDPQYAEPLRGRDAIRKDVEDFFVSFPDVTSTLSTVVAEGEIGAVEFLMTGTNDGPIVMPDGNLPATGRKIEMRVGAFVTVDRDGLITESRRYFDLAGLMQQIGVE